MIDKYPYNIITKSGYKAIVTNPEKYRYHFDVTFPIGYESFDWLEQEYNNGNIRTGQAGEIDQFKDEILLAFWQAKS